MNLFPFPSILMLKKNFSDKKETNSTTVPKKELSRIYKERFKTVSAKLYEEYWNGSLFRDVLIKEKTKIFDAGCSYGFTLDYLKKKYGVKASGSDINFQMLLSAKKNGFNVLNASLLNLPVRSCSFDIIISKGVLHHIKDYERAVFEIKRTLKEGGIAVISEPNSFNFFLKLPRMIVNSALKRKGIYHRSFTQNEILKCFKGFKTVKKAYFGYFGFLICYMNEKTKILNFLPFKKTITKILIAFDKILSRIPLVKTQSVHFILYIEKK